jgi:riboflavin transporter FmnP
MNNDAKRKRNKTKLHNLVKIAILSAVATVIMLLEFSVPIIAPKFYRLDLSEAVILIGGFAMGPFSALIMELIKNILNLMINSTVTGGIGELANFLTGAAFTVTASFIYKYHKSIKGALVSCLVGIVSLTVLAAVINYFIVIPAYASIMTPGIEEIIKMGAAVNSNVDSLLDFVLICVVPFNLLKGIACSIITFLLYKRVSPILHI